MKSVLMAMRNMWWHFRFLFGQKVFLNCLTECQTSCLGYSICLGILSISIYIYRKNKNLTALKSNSNTVWFNFQTYIIFSINLVSFKVTLRSSGTDILYGCHLLLDVCIIYFISCDCIVNNSSLSYPIY